MVIADDLVVVIADDLVVAIADDLVVNDVVIAYVVFAVLALSTTFAKRQSSLAWTQPTVAISAVLVYLPRVHQYSFTLWVVFLLFFKNTPAG